MARVRVGASWPQLGPWLPGLQVMPGVGEPSNASLPQLQLGRPKGVEIAAKSHGKVSYGTEYGPLLGFLLESFECVFVCLLELREVASLNNFFKMNSESFLAQEVAKEMV